MQPYHDPIREEKLSLKHEQMFGGLLAYIEYVNQGQTVKLFDAPVATYVYKDAWLLINTHVTLDVTNPAHLNVLATQGRKQERPRCHTKRCAASAWYCASTANCQYTFLSIRGDSLDIWAVSALVREGAGSFPLFLDIFVSCIMHQSLLSRVRLIHVDRTSHALLVHTAKTSQVLKGTVETSLHSLGFETTRPFGCIVGLCMS